MADGDLQRRIGKRKPFGSWEEAVLLNLIRTTDRVQSLVARVLKEHGLTHAQYNVLRILRGLAKPTPILEIADRMLTETPGITGLIDRLEKLEFVSRKRCEEDRRVIYVVLDAKAEALLGELDGPMAELRTRICEGLSREELETLSRLLDRVREPLEGP